MPIPSLRARGKTRSGTSGAYERVLSVRTSSAACVEEAAPFLGSPAGGSEEPEAWVTSFRVDDEDCQWARTVPRNSFKTSGCTGLTRSGTQPSRSARPTFRAASRPLSAPKRTSRRNCGPSRTQNNSSTSEAPPRSCSMLLSQPLGCEACRSAAAGCDRSGARRRVAASGEPRSAAALTRESKWTCTGVQSPLWNSFQSPGPSSTARPRFPPRRASARRSLPSPSNSGLIAQRLASTW
mmetsp:Transcript_111362/g.314391  ORF Transcript_111362/g.314391 Transcript_111362/m.314391 type:complete len:238 (+) Transcript_111362:107-820(+)